MMTCTIIMSGSLIGFHFGFVATSRTRTPSWSISSLMSTSMCSGNVGRQALDLDVAADELDQAALLLDALRLAVDEHRDGHLQELVHRDAVEVGVEHRVRDRVELEVLHEHARVARARQLQRDQRVLAGLGVENLQQRLGRHRNRRRAFAVAAVEHRRDLAFATRAPRLIFSERIACLRFEYGFHMFLLTCRWCYWLAANLSPEPYLYTNNEDTDVSS